MPRRYIIALENIAITAAQDLVQVKGATGKMLRIIRAWAGVTDTTLVTAQSLRFRSRFLPATVTDGNGGAGTISKVDPGDAGASFTAIVNSTTQATSSNTPVLLDANGEYILNGYRAPATWMVNDGQYAPPIGPLESFVLEMLSSGIAGPVHMSFGVEVQEIGG